VTPTDASVDQGTQIWAQTRSRADLIEPDNTYTDWTVNIRAIKHVLGRPYTVIVFDGDFNPDPSTWMAEYNKVDIVAVLGQDVDTACAKCRED
jgi:tyrosinase